jgi:hypothetical protein
MWGKADGALCRHRGYEPAPHHRLLIDRLERVACGEIKRPAVFMPPGSAKSTYASVLFPPHVMASAASRAILATSHTTEESQRDRHVDVARAAGLPCGDAVQCRSAGFAKARYTSGAARLS